MNNNVFDANSVMLMDVKKLRKMHHKLEMNNEALASEGYQKWLRVYKNAQKKVEDRQKAVPKIDYPVSLPVSQKQAAIKKLIMDNQVVIIAGETGSGKTTQLPKMCLELGLASLGMIGHTQPRRLAAQTIAQRVSDELNCQVGECIGYQVRFLDKTNANSLVKLMTDGILLNEIKRDPLLLNYKVIIIDEAHERSLNIDFLLGYLKRIIPKRPDLKIIITSATINVELFSNHFNHAPTFQVSGRTYPIETIYLAEESEQLFNDLPDQIIHSIRTIEQLELAQKSVRTGGNILVFLACERDIKDTQLRLKKQGYLHEHIYPLYARLSRKEQSKIFSSQRSGRKIILSTNIAETSLTIPGVGYVIDSGQVRISRYNYRSKIQQLPIENVSKASANQRQGRCGREGPGVCYRLYTESTYELMTNETPAEILRTNLASVLLMSLNLNIGDLAHFPFIQKPDNRYIKDAFKLLEELHALNAKNHLSAIGKTLANLTIDPRLGRMILASEKLNCLNQVTVIAACLAIQDPREYPTDKQEYSRQMHARFRDKSQVSDFHSMLLLWCYFQEQKKLLSKNALRKKLIKECLNVNRLFEWEDLVFQLLEQRSKKYINFTETEISIEVAHRACLSGLLSNIGKLDENKEFIGARNKRFIVFPGSSLYKKPPFWLMAAQLVETDKLYSRMCAPFDTTWLFDYAKHLIKHKYSEPHWSKKNKKAMVYQSSLLFGLLINDNERVLLSSVDKGLAREVFIKEVFVNNKLSDYLIKAPAFWLNNQRLIEDINDLESKSRRMDVLIDDESHYLLYSKKIPEAIFDLITFKQWLKTEPDVVNKQLCFKRQDLMQHSAFHITGNQFPDYIEEAGYSFKLSYHFSPQDIDDGVSVIVPLQKVIHCSEDIFSWLVPGLLEEKCVAILKNLPKRLRKTLMPIPDLVQDILFDRQEIAGNLLDFLEYKIKELKHIRVDRNDFDLAKLDDFYLMNIKVIDKNNKLIAQSRNLENLKKELNTLLEKTVNKNGPLYNDAGSENRYTDWTFNSIEQAYKNNKKQAGFYPSLVRVDEFVILKLLSSKMRSDYETRKSLVFFIKNRALKNVRYMEKNLFKSKEAALVLSRQGDLEQLKKNLIESLIEMTFLNSNPLPQKKLEFEDIIEQSSSNLIPNFQRYEVAMISTIKLRLDIEKDIALLANNYRKSIDDIINQLSLLFCDNYPLLAGEYLINYPRYLKAIKTRLTKLPRQEDRDILLMNEALIYETKLVDEIKKDEMKIVSDPDLKAFRFLLEEFRISLFDQTMKTIEKVSLKRLEKSWIKLIKY